LRGSSARDDDTRILPERAQQLSVARIDGVDEPRAGVEQDAGEAAGRGSDVDRDAPGNADPERGQRRAELRLAAQRPAAPIVIDTSARTSDAAFLATSPSTRTSPRLINASTSSI